MPDLYLTCKLCGKNFYSGVNAPLALMHSKNHHCVECGETSMYHQHDYDVTRPDRAE